MSIEIKISSIIARLISIGNSTPIAIEKRNTPFSITRKPIRWAKIRLRITIRIRPESPEGEVTMPSYEIEALIEVAKAYLARTIANSTLLKRWRDN